jgi:hypothetical protein
MPAIEQLLDTHIHHFRFEHCAYSSIGAHLATGQRQDEGYPRVDAEVDGEYQELR